MRLRQHKHEENVGGFKVIDQTGQAWICDTCGEWEVSLDALATYQLRAVALVLRERTNAGGPVMRYARKALGLTQVDLGVLLGHQPETISRLETSNGPIHAAERLALAGLVEGVLRKEIDLDACVTVARQSAPPMAQVLEYKKAI